MEERLTKTQLVTGGREEEESFILILEEMKGAAWQKSRRAAAGRAQLLAKKGASGRMQRLTELVPIRYGPLMRREGSVKVTAFWQNPEKNWSAFSKILAKFANMLAKISKKLAHF